MTTYWRQRRSYGVDSCSTSSCTRLFYGWRWGGSAIVLVSLVSKILVLSMQNCDAHLKVRIVINQDKVIKLHFDMKIILLIIQKILRKCISIIR